MAGKIQTFGINTATGSLSLLALLLTVAVPFANAQAPVANLSPARTLFDTLRSEETFKGNGASLGYALGHGGVIPASVIVSRNGKLLRSPDDYTMDAKGGILTLVRSATQDESILVRYRYTPGVVGLSEPQIRNANGIVATPTFISGMPSVQVGKIGLGFVRSDTGQSTNALLQLQTSGLAFFSGGGLMPQASALQGAPNEKSSTNEYVVAQNRSLGGKGAQVTFNYQTVSKNFQNFAALKQMGADSQANIAQLEKERGMKRMGYGVALGVKANGNIKFNQDTLSGGGGDIERQALSLNSGGLSISMNSIAVARQFARWKDLADSDLVAGMNREQFEKEMKGVTKRDISASFKANSKLSLQGTLTDWSRETDETKRDSTKNSRLTANFAPNKTLTFNLLDEKSQKSSSGKVTEQRVNRAYTLSTNQSKPTAVSFYSRTTKLTDAAGKKQNEQQTRIEGKTVVKVPRKALPGILSPAISFTMMQDQTTVKEEAGANRKTDIIASLFGVRSEGDSPVRFNYEEKSKTIRPGEGDSVNQDIKTVDTKWQITKTALFSYMGFSDLTTTGNAKTDIEKESMQFSMGRGWSYGQSLDKTVRVAQNGDTEEIRNDSMTFSTDSSAPLWVAGEKRMLQGEKDAEEHSQTWRSGINFGALSLKIDGLGVRRLNMPTLLKNEKNINVAGALKLFSGWTARYNFYDRLGKDPQTKLDRDEMLREWTIDSGAKSPLKIGFVSRTFDNRYTGQSERVRQETTFSPLKPLRIGFLNGGNVTLAYGSDRIKGTDREGVTRKMIYSGTLSGNKIAMELGNGQDANGLPALSKAISLTTKPGRLQFSTRQGMRQVSQDKNNRESQWSRTWEASFQVRKNQMINYTLAIRPERPDTTWEARRSEQIAYTAQFGNGGKLLVEYRNANDYVKKVGTRSTLFSLVSPTSALKSYEFSYLKESTISGNQHGEMNTYIVAYQYLPTNMPLSVNIGARWFDYGGTLAPSFSIHDRTMATIEIKSAW